jgi:hypothetical protein
MLDYNIRWLLANVVSFASAHPYFVGGSGSARDADLLRHGGAIWNHVQPSLWEESG